MMSVLAMDSTTHPIISAVSRSGYFIINHLLL
jgi:hypothetical protein